MRTRDIVLALGFSTWSEARTLALPVQRTLGDTLMQHDRVDRVLIADPPRSWVVGTVSGRTRREAAEFERSDRATLVQPQRLRRRDPATARAVRAGSVRHGRAIARAARRRGLRTPILISTDPFLLAHGRLDWAAGATYYAVDDWAAHPSRVRWHAAYTQAYERIARRGIAVCAVSQAIIDRIAPLGPSAVMPNGVEPEVWSEIPPAPRWMAELPSPRLVYAGTLDTRLDVRRVAEIAERFPLASIVLIGPRPDADHLRPLERFDNVHLLGAVDRRELAGALGVAEVGLVPHLRTPLTEAMSPLKLYEYLAAGCAVVAADLPPLRGVHPHAELVPPDGDFASAVARALTRGRLTEGDRRAFVEQHSWARRHEIVLDLALAQASSPQDRSVVR